MSVQVTREWSCVLCSDTVSIVDSAAMPAGWSRVQDGDYCDRHVIVVTYRLGQIATVDVREEGQA